MRAMKGMDLFCYSTASTAIASHSKVRRSTKRHGSSVRRKGQLVHVPCSSKLPFIPKPYNNEKRKNSSTVNNLYHSSKYLLSDTTPFIHWASHSHKIPALPPPNKPQVVVLRVSLHCKACEGKVRKHISKMEGVTSFSIDMEAKKVTIIGDVTPLGVLASVSRVKNAQLWP